MQIFGGVCIFGLLCSVLLVKGGEEWGGGEKERVGVKGRITAVEDRCIAESFCAVTRLFVC